MRNYTYLMLVMLFIFIPCMPVLAEIEAIALLKKIDELYRAKSSVSIIKMSIITPNWQRTLKIQSWTIGMDDTFIRILAPKKDRGVATLKKGSEMWNYFPKINKVIKVPPSMMMGSWMGSDFTNDDLVREVSLVKEYNVEKKELENKIQLILIPKEKTVTVWARIELVVEKNSLLPLEQSYFNEKGDKVRSLSFSSVREFSGRRLPAIMTMVPQNKPGRKTVIEYLEMTFNENIKQEVFTLRNLKKRY